MTGALIFAAIVLIAVALVCDWRSQQSLSRGAAGPNTPPPPNGSPLRSGESEGRPSTADRVAAVIVGVAFGLCAVIWIVLFCVAGAIA
jgi:hypothetical protein